MKTIRLPLVAVITGVIGLAAESPGRPVSLHWSETAAVKSPDGQFEIEVQPILTDEENHSPVVVRRLSDGRQWRLFTLARAAEALWSGDSHRILVINQATADRYEVHLYSREGRRTEVDTDSTIRSALGKQLGDGRQVEFYLPSFVSWTGGELVLAVGGTSFEGVRASTRSFCFAVSVDSGSGKVLAMKRQTDSRCRINP